MRFSTIRSLILTLPLGHRVRFTIMPMPPEPFTITGGCNCRSIRYTINVPAFSDRPASVYCSPGASLPPDAKIPFIAIDHCNDCRRASGALLPIALVTETSTGQLSFSSGPWQPALNFGPRRLITCSKSRPLDITSPLQVEIAGSAACAGQCCSTQSRRTPFPVSGVGRRCWTYGLER